MVLRYKNENQTALFRDWTIAEFKLFFEAFLQNYDLNDVVSEVDSKSAEEVYAYYKVFIKRCNELKCYDQVV